VDVDAGNPSLDYGRAPQYLVHSVCS